MQNLQTLTLKLLFAGLENQRTLPSFESGPKLHRAGPPRLHGLEHRQVCRGGATGQVLTSKRRLRHGAMGRLEAETWRSDVGFTAHLLQN